MTEGATPDKISEGDWLDLDTDLYCHNEFAELEYAVVLGAEQLDLQHWTVSTTQGDFTVPTVHELRKRTEWPEKPSGDPGPLVN